MLGRVVIYSIVGCPHCLRAKNTLQELDIPYTDVSVDQYPKDVRESVQKLTGKTSVPQIFFNEHYIGGNDDLQELIKNKEKFEKLLDDVRSNSPPEQAPIPPDPKTMLKSSDSSFDFVCEKDDYAILVQELKQSGIICDHPRGLFKKNSNTFTGRAFVDWVMKNKSVDRSVAIEMGQELINRHFGHNVSSTEVFKDEDVLYRLLEDDNLTALNAGDVSDCKLSSAGELGEQLRKMILKIYSANLSKDGRAVDYKGIARSEDFDQYVIITKELQRLQVENLTREEKLTFFINIYNALVIHTTVVRGAPVNIWQRYKFFNTSRYLIGGATYSLQDIENGVLRSNKKGMGMLFKPFGKSDPRLKIALSEVEPLIHFGLVCGAKSCPPIKSYSAKDVEEELRLAAQSFLEGDDGCKIDTDNNTIWLSKIFSWYYYDFGKNDKELLGFIKKYMADGEKKTQLEKVISGDQYRVAYMKYDWGLNSK